jgi:hypothetical protein
MLELPHGAADRDHGMPWQVRHQVRRDADRPHAWAAAAVRNRKGFVQVQVADVGADRRRTRQPDLRVHVRAVHVHLAAVVVDDGADLADALLEDPVGGRIGHHQRRQRVVMRLGLGAQVVELDIPLAVAGDDDDAEARHRCARGIGPVGRGGNEHDVPRQIAAVAVIRADRHQPGELTLRP